MQTRTILALLCTIVVLFIGINDGAPTVSVKVVTTKTDAPPVVTPAIKKIGGRADWKNKADPKSKKLFNDYKKVIAKKLQAAHKVPASFVPKPQKFSSQLVSGMLYHYLVKLPVKKFAYVTIIDRPWKKGEYGKEEHVNVSPKLFELNDQNIKWTAT